MPDHAQETVLLHASWAKVFQATGINLVRTPQLAKLVSAVLTVSACYFLRYTMARKFMASSKPSSALSLK